MANTLVGTKRPTIRVVEVGPRDGLQNEAKPLPTNVKIELIERLVNAGIQAIEATSFVRADRIPQLADADELFPRITRKPNVRYIALAPNKRALDRAAAVGVEEIAVFGAASQTFSQRNIGCSIEDSIAMFGEVSRTAIAMGMRVRGYVSTILGCPFEGSVPADEVARVIDAMIDMGCAEVSLGDTVGVGTYGEVQDLFAFLGSRFPVSMLAAHMHDTYGQGLANTMAAIDAGVTIVDSSVGGLGGCPFAGGGARGNLATEDLVYALDRSGFATGIDLAAVVDAAHWISTQLGRGVSSRVASVMGPRSPTVQPIERPTERRE